MLCKELEYTGVGALSEGFGVVGRDGGPAVSYRKPGGSAGRRRDGLNAQLLHAVQCPRWGR